MGFVTLFLVVIIGAFIAFFLKPQSFIISHLLTFSGGYLLSITLLHFLPEVYHEDHHIGVFVILGLMFQLILDFYSKGAEHGHFHHLSSKVFPWTLFISLNIHAFMEGLPLANHQHNDLLWAIIIHKLPIAIVLTTFLVHVGMKNWKVFGFILFFSFMTPLSSKMGDQISFIMTYSNQINAFVAGSLLHIATTILSESSKDHKFNTFKFIMVLLGIGLALAV